MSSINLLDITRLALSIGLIMVFPSVHAATINVNSDTDIDGDDVHCTLREAIVSINDQSAGSTGCFYTGIFGTNDTIVFDIILNNQTIGLDQSLALSITRDVVINGPGDTLLTVDGSANGSAGVFDISNSSVELNGLTVSGGYTSASGGGILVSNSTISLTGSTVSGNQAEYDGGGILVNNSSVTMMYSTVSNSYANGVGGGIYAEGSSISLTDSTISGNTSFNDGGGIDASNSTISLTGSTVSGNRSEGYGGGIVATNSSVVSLINTTISGNTAYDDAGGIDASNSTISLTGSTVSGNRAAGNGGGILAINCSISLTDSIVSANWADFAGGGILIQEGSTSLTDSIVSGNHWSVYGGGIYISGGSISLTDSIVSGNSAGSGGGIFAINSSDVSLTGSTVSGNSTAYTIFGAVGGGIFTSDSTADLINSTLSGNSAEDGGGGISADGASIITLVNSTLSNNTTTNLGGGFLVNGTSNVGLSNSIVSGNSSAGGAAEIMNEGTGLVTAGNKNLLGDSSRTNAQAFVNFTPNLLGTDIIATSDGNAPASLSSILSPLTDNGGPTQTHALQGGSVAIDAGDDAVCAAPPVNNLDQRGITRPQGIHCDIGAFEFIPPGLTLIKHVTNDNGGGAVPANFDLHLTGGIYTDSTIFKSGATPTVETNTSYTLSETALEDYEQTGIACTDDDGGASVGHPVTLAEGQFVTCTISNDDNSQTLTVLKQVTNDNGGNAVPAHFVLRVSGGAYDASVARTSGDSLDISENITYTLSEDPFTGYTQTGIECKDANTDVVISHPVTLILGQSAICTISNNDNPPGLTIIKHVTNDNGGNAIPTHFTLRVFGGIYDGSVARTSGDTLEVVGNVAYTLGEDLLIGYTQTGVECKDTRTDVVISHPVTLVEGQFVTCTISNDDIAPELTIVKVVVNDHDGIADSGDFTLRLTGGVYDGSIPRKSGDLLVLDANTAYRLSEDPLEGYSQMGITCVDTDTSTNIGHPVTLAEGQSAICTISNLDYISTFYVIPLPNGGAVIFDL